MISRENHIFTLLLRLFFCSFLHSFSFSFFHLSILLYARRAEYFKLIFVRDYQQKSHDQLFILKCGGRPDPLVRIVKSSVSEVISFSGKWCHPQPYHSVVESCFFFFGWRKCHSATIRDISNRTGGGPQGCGVVGLAIRKRKIQNWLHKRQTPIFPRKKRTFSLAIVKQ